MGIWLVIARYWRYLAYVALAILCCMFSVVPIGAQEVVPIPAAPERKEVAISQLRSVQVQQILQSPNDQVGQYLQVALTINSQTLEGCFGTPRQMVDAIVLLDTLPRVGVVAIGFNTFPQLRDVVNGAVISMDIAPQVTPSPTDSFAPTQALVAPVEAVATGVPLSTTVSLGLGNSAVGLRLPVSLWLIGVPLLLVFIALIIRFIKGRGNKIPAFAAEPPKPLKFAPKGFNPELNTGLNESTLLEEEERFKADIRDAKTVRGYIPTSQSGMERSRINGILLKKAQQIKASGGFNPENLGDEFIWQQDVGARRVRATWLREALEQRISAATPLLVVYTEQPSDPTRFAVTVNCDEQKQEMVIKVVSSKVSSTTEPVSERAYWIEMCILDNPHNYTIKFLPVMAT